MSTKPFNPPKNPQYRVVFDAACAAIEKGGGTVGVGHLGGLLRSVAVDFVRNMARARGMTASFSDGFNVVIAPADGVGKRAQRGERRQQIEALEPGQSTTIMTTGMGQISSIRVTISKLKAGTEREYVTTTADDYSSITITRVDGFDGPAPEQRKRGAPERHGIGAMKHGEIIAIGPELQPDINSIKRIARYHTRNSKESVYIVDELENGGVEVICAARAVFSKQALTAIKNN